MKLHLQKSAQRWLVVESEPASFKKGKPLFAQIRDILSKEKNNPSEIRTASGFHVVLTPEEKTELYNRVRTLHEPLHGKMDDEEILRILRDMIEGEGTGIRVYGYNALHERRISKKAALLEPDFCFGAESWLK